MEEKVSISDNFHEILKLARAKWSLKLELMLDHLKMVKCTVLVHLLGMMVKYMKDSLKEVKCMEMVKYFIQMVKWSKVYGIVDKT